MLCASMCKREMITMAIFVATYDLKKTIPDPYSAFLDSAGALGWKPTIDMAGSTARLPNTTLVGAFASIDAASTAFELARARASSALGSTVVVEASYLSEVVG
jgi:hypothetical protein